MRIKYVPSMQSVWLTAILNLRVNVQNALLQEDLFVVVMEKLISMNVNCKNNLVQRKLTLEFFIKANAVSSSLIIELMRLPNKLTILLPTHSLM